MPRIHERKRSVPWLASLYVLLAASTAGAEPLPVPTRVDVYTHTAETPPCIAGLKRDGCTPHNKPRVIKGKDAARINALLRNTSTYGSAFTATFAPRRTLVFYYGTSVIDTYALCLDCPAVEIIGSNPFIGCEPTATPSHQGVMKLDEAARDALRESLEHARRE